MLDEAVRFLICPHCGEALQTADRTLRCRAGHAYDVARQGYVSLLPAGARGLVGDAAAMVQARERFLAAGHFAPIADALADLADSCPPDEPGCVADVGAGSGTYLTAVLERHPKRVGLALDASKHALRRAARAHDRIGAVGCDIWRGLPVADRAAVLALNVFAPRNAAELRRILHPSGRLLVVTPTDRHLGELVSALDLLSVDERKPERLATHLDPYFDQLEQRTVSASMAITHDDAVNLVAMGPSARHVAAPEIDIRIRQLPEPLTATLSVTVGVYGPIA